MADSDAKPRGGRPCPSEKQERGRRHLKRERSFCGETRSYGRTSIPGIKTIQKLRLMRWRRNWESADDKPVGKAGTFVAPKIKKHDFRLYTIDKAGE